MRLPIDTASVKLAATRPIRPDLNDVGIRARYSSDPMSVVGGLQAAKVSGCSCREVATCRDGGTSDDLLEMDNSDRPLGKKEHFLLTVAEVAYSLSLSRTKVYELLYAGELPSVKIGASRRVRKTDLETFVTNLELVN